MYVTRDLPEFDRDQVRVVTFSRSWVVSVRADGWVVLGRNCRLTPPVASTCLGLRLLDVPRSPGAAVSYDFWGTGTRLQWRIDVTIDCASSWRNGGAVYEGLRFSPTGSFRVSLDSVKS